MNQPESRSLFIQRSARLFVTIKAFAQAVTPISTFWGKPLTVAQLRKDPFKDPATAGRMGFMRPIPEACFPPRMQIRPANDHASEG
ncbi:MAG: hypothetical protein WAW13_00695 [Minisyncoccia bacterium]